MEEAEEAEGRSGVKRDEQMYVHSMESSLVSCLICVSPLDVWKPAFFLQDQREAKPA